MGLFVEVITIKDFFRRYSKEILLVMGGLLCGIFSVFMILKTKKEKLKGLAEKNLQEYQKFLISMTNKLYARIYQYNITENSIANDYTKAILLKDGFLPNMTYEEILEFDAINHIEESFQNKYIGEFSFENLLNQYDKGNHSLSFQYLRLFANNEYLWFQDIANIFYNDKDIHIIIFRENIDSEKRRENLLIDRAKRDSATGFYNKIAAKEAVEKLLRFNTTRLSAFIVLDIDKFKNVNDKYGHVFGDKVIEMITNGIETIFRETDVLGRLGGDEFIVFVADIKNANTVRIKGEELCELVRNITFEENQDYIPTVSVGMTVSKENDTFEEMYAV